MTLTKWLKYIWKFTWGMIALPFRIFAYLFLRSPKKTEKKRHKKHSKYYMKGPLTRLVLLMEDIILLPVTLILKPFDWLGDMIGKLFSGDE